VAHFRSRLNGKRHLGGNRGVDYAELAKQCKIGTMTDDDIKKMWAEHYPSWRRDREAERVCFAICTVLEAHARALPIVGTDADRLRRVLIAVGIPAAQYHELKNDPKRS
jgi:hypothetical protein